MTVLTAPEESVMPIFDGSVGCQASDSTRVAKSSVCRVWAGVRRFVVVLRRKRASRPVEAAAQRRVGSCGLKWMSRIA